MNRIEKTLCLDVSGNRRDICTVGIEGDKGTRFLHVLLFQAGEKLVPEAGVQARFRALKPDGTSILNPATVNADGSVTAELTEQALAVPGKVQADISLWKGNQVLSTAAFEIWVKAAPLGNPIASQSQLLALEQAMAGAEQVNASVTKSGSRAAFTVTDRQGTAHQVYVDDGIGIASASIVNGELVFTKTDGSTTNVGAIPVPVATEATVGGIKDTNAPEESYTGHLPVKVFNNGAAYALTKLPEETPLGGNLLGCVFAQERNSAKDTVEVKQDRSDGRLYVPGNVFVAAYGATTYAQVNNAVNAGKAVFVIKDGVLYTLSSKYASNGYYYFYSLGTGTSETKLYAYCRPNQSLANTWATGTTKFVKEDRFEAGIYIGKNHPGSKTYKKGFHEIGDYYMNMLDGNRYRVTAKEDAPEAGYEVYTWVQL